MYLLTTTLNIFLIERRSNILTETKLIKAALGLKHSVALSTKSVNTEAFNFFLTACSKGALEFAIWSCSMKIGHDHFFKTLGVVLWRWEYTCLWMEMPMRIKTDGHQLTHRIGYSWLASIPAIDLHMFVDFRKKVSSTTALRVKMIERPPTTSSEVFSDKSLSGSVMG